MKRWMFGAGLAAMLVAACTQLPPEEVEKPSSETADALEDWPHGGMVTAGDPRAVEAGLSVLAEGGHAVDAAIAVHAVLGLVEPQSSGLGGGAFMLVYDRRLDELIVYDGRETAPQAADENLFMVDGEGLGFLQAWQSGRSTGVPGVVALYEMAHQAHGQVGWGRLYEDAIELAEAGFEVSPRLAEMLANERLRRAIRLDDHPVSAAYFYPDGAPLAAGDVRKNPPYAETLRAISETGALAFYAGEIAEAIVSTVAEEPLPGRLSVEDIAAYQPIKRAALCQSWRDYEICSAPPPSSGGIAQNMIMGLYDRLSRNAEPSEESYLKAFVDAQRLAYADRDHYVADADQVFVPSEALIDAAYLDARAGEVFGPAATPVPGDPGAVLGTGPMVDLWGRDTTQDVPGTTHISIIDQAGNAVSMTATVEAPFGSSRMVKGFLLNNELTDFALNPRKGGKLVANAPAGGKRPRSSMSPTIIFDETGELAMVTGSPGGNSIIAYVSKSIVGVLDWGKTAEEAVRLPNIVARGEKVTVEVDRPGGPEAAEALIDMGYNVIERRGENSGLNIIVVRETGLEGAADPRREGVAVAIE